MDLARHKYPNAEAVSFKCPTCEAEYRVLRVEAPATHSRQMLCLSCGGPLRNRDGKFALKYLRTGVVTQTAGGQTPA